MKRNQDLPFHLTYYDLRALLHWAAIGISMQKGGSYTDAAESPGYDIGIINSYAEHIKFMLPVKPRFKP